jgi:hypothetical protein
MRKLLRVSEGPSNLSANLVGTVLFEHDCWNDPFLRIKLCGLPIAFSLQQPNRLEAVVAIDDIHAVRF